MLLHSRPFLDRDGEVRTVPERSVGSHHVIPPRALFAGTDLNYLVEGESPLPLLDAGQIMAVRVVATWKDLLEARSLTE